MFDITLATFASLARASAKKAPSFLLLPFKWHVVDERNFLLFSGRPILQKYEADRGRDLHTHKLRDVEIRHRCLGYQLEWLPPRHHSRQGSEWVFFDANHLQLIRRSIGSLTCRNADSNANAKLKNKLQFFDACDTRERIIYTTQLSDINALRKYACISISYISINKLANRFLQQKYCMRKLYSVLYLIWQNSCVYTINLILVFIHWRWGATLGIWKTYFRTYCSVNVDVFLQSLFFSPAVVFKLHWFLIHHF